VQKKKPKIHGGFIVIPKNTIKSDRYHSLRPHTRSVYAAILVKFTRHKKLNPKNEVTITHNQMETISGISHGSVVRAVRELKQKGFMTTLIPGGLEGDPTTFQLNDRYLDVGNSDAYW